MHAVGLQRFSCEIGSGKNTAPIMHDHAQSWGRVDQIVDVAKFLARFFWI